MLSCLADEVAYKSAIHTYAIATPNYDTMGQENKDCQNIHMYTNLEDIVPKIPINFKKVGVEKSYSYDTLSSEDRAGFDRVYKYFRGKTYTEDGDKNSTDLVGQLRDHMGFTYMSFMLSEKSDSEIDNYIAAYEPLTLGDLNSDGDINIKDVTMIQKHIAELEQLSKNQSICADTNGDGTINIHDATLIQKYIVKLIVKF